MSATGTPPPALSVRRASVADAPAVAEVQVLAWQAAYVGLMPQDYLDALEVADRTAYWQAGLARSTPGVRALVLTADSLVAGFAVVGPAHDDAPSTLGELYAINLRPDAWGRGAGALLLAAAQEALVDLGYAEAVLWVVPGNTRARRFYERHGWGSDGVERVATVFGVTVPEVRYRRRLV